MIRSRFEGLRGRRLDGSGLAPAAAGEPGEEAESDDEDRDGYRKRSPHAVRSRNPWRRCAAASASSGVLPPVCCASVVVNRSSSVSIGTSTPLAERLDERLGLERLRAVLALERQRQADDDELRLVLGDERREPVEPRLGRRALDDADRSRERAGRVGDGDAGARGAVVERENLHRAARISRSASASASGSFAASLPPARAIVGRPPPPPPTSGAAPRITSERADALGDGLVEVRDERDSALLRGAEHDRRRRVTLLEAVGELEQRVAVEALHELDDEVDAVDRR